MLESISDEEVRLYSCIRQYVLSNGFDWVDLNYVDSAPHTVQLICNS